MRRRDTIHAGVRSHPLSCPRTFWSELVSIFSSSLLTTLYNDDSHLFSILLNPSPPALVMLQALDHLTALRMGSRPRGTLSRELSTLGRPRAPLGRVLSVERQIMS